MDRNYNPNRVLSFEEKERMELQKIQLYYKQDGVCAACGEFIDTDVYDVAHIIPTRKHHIKNYGWEVLDHILNQRATHRGACNNMVMKNPDTNFEWALQHVNAIKEALIEENI